MNIEIKKGLPVLELSGLARIIEMQEKDIKLVDLPPIKGRDLIVAAPFPVFRKLPEAVVLVLKVTHQAGHPDIQNPVSLSARFHAKGACGPYFP